MELKLQRAILAEQPELTIKQVEEKARDIANYWIESCLSDVLEAES